MNQKQFTEYVIFKLLERFPEFKGHCQTKDSDVVDIEYNSPNSLIELFITTQDIEITVGIINLKTLVCDWHTHITPYDFTTINDDIMVAIKTIENILTDKWEIRHSETNGYTLNHFSLISQNLDERVKIEYWSNL